MAISYATGPTINRVIPAYNPIKIQIHDDGVGGATPVIYCDVYMNEVYYKTVTSSSPILITGTATVWEVDISGVAQEYLKSKVPDITNPFSGGLPVMEELYLAPPSFNLYTHGGAARCRCKARRGTADAYGVVTPQTPVPVQETVDSAAIAGGGYAIDPFLIVNSALQLNSEHTTNMEYQLGQYKRTGVISTAGYQVQGENKIYPLSKLVSGKIYNNDYGQFPIVLKRDCFFAPGGSYVNSSITAIAVECYDKNGVRIYAAPSAGQTIYGESILNIPTGVKNLLALFPLMAAALPNTAWYQVFLYNNLWASIDPSQVCFVTPKYYLQQPDVANQTEHIRVWFRNFLGHMDTLNFRVFNEQGKSTSSPTEARRTTSRVNASQMRNNVRSNRMAEVTDVFDEWELPMIEELCSTAQAYVETTNPPYPTPAGQNRLMPIVIEDMEYIQRRHEGRYQYEVTIKYMLSHENVSVRG